MHYLVRDPANEELVILCDDPRPNFHGTVLAREVDFGDDLYVWTGGTESPDVGYFVGESAKGTLKAFQTADAMQREKHEPYSRWRGPVFWSWAEYCEATGQSP